MYAVGKGHRHCERGGGGGGGESRGGEGERAGEVRGKGESRGQVLRDMQREEGTDNSPPFSQWPRLCAPAPCGTYPMRSSASPSRGPPVSPWRGPSQPTSLAAHTGRRSLGPCQTERTQPPGGGGGGGGSASKTGRQLVCVSAWLTG